MDDEETGSPRSADLATAVRAARESVNALVRRLDDGAAALPGDASTLYRTVGRLLGDLAGTAKGRDEGAAAAQSVFVDVSDLLGYFPHNRLPTGVQRVQISTIRALLAQLGGGQITLCRFIEGRDIWQVVPVQGFQDVCEMSLIGSDPTEISWHAQVAALESAIHAGAPLQFPQGACLVNVGTSWWLPNYFLYIREAKRQSDLRYIPLIHDLIPVLKPEYCTPELVQEFIGWLLGVLRHADYFLAVSESTKADLIALAGELGRTLSADVVRVVPLATEPNGTAIQEEAKRVSLGRWNLDVRPFVLFVSTIEARKNQVGAVDAWHQLILKHGKDKVPQLVLVGKRGFGSEQALDRVALNPDLTDRVTVLHSATDAELEALYRKCLFTIYPSIYEGWGLPVTESLIHGKVPLTSNNSSLPQAGGGFSVQFDARSNAAFLDALESLIFDAAKREALEKRIVEGFRMRRWADVGNDIFSAVAGWTKIEDGRGKWQPATAQPGYYPLTRNREKRLSPLLDSAEVFRQGGWWRLEDFGSWTKPRGGEIAVRPASLPARMAVELVGIGGEPTPYRVSVAGGGVQFGTLHRNDHKWVFLDLPEGAGPEVRIHIHSQRAATVVDPITEERRELAVGVAGFFLFGEDTIESRFDFVEAVALGSLRDHLFGRSAWPDEGNAG